MSLTVMLKNVNAALKVKAIKLVSRRLEAKTKAWPRGLHHGSFVMVALAISAFGIMLNYWYSLLLLTVTSDTIK